VAGDYENASGRDHPVRGGSARGTQMKIPYFMVAVVLAIAGLAITGLAPTAASAKVTRLEITSRQP
jgi:hypothetical protein